MHSFEVDAAKIATASSTVSRTGAAIRAEVTAMQRHLQDLQGSWRGAASASFAEVVGNWSQVQQRVDEGLEQITRALSVAAQTYSDAEDHAARLFRAG